MKAQANLIQQIKKNEKYHIHDKLETQACKFPSKIRRYEKKKLLAREIDQKW